MKKYACVLDQLFDDFCIPNSFQAQAEVIFALYIWGNQRRKLVFIIGIVMPKKQGHWVSQWVFFRSPYLAKEEKSLLMNEKLKKNKSTYIENHVKNIIMACHLWWEWKFAAVEFSSASANISKSAARYYLLDCFIWIKLTLKFQKEPSTPTFFIQGFAILGDILLLLSHSLHPPRDERLILYRATVDIIEPQGARAVLLWHEFHINVFLLLYICAVCGF